MSWPRLQFPKPCVEAWKQPRHCTRAVRAFLTGYGYSDILDVIKAVPCTLVIPSSLPADIAPSKPLDLGDQVVRHRRRSRNCTTTAGQPPGSCTLEGDRRLPGGLAAILVAVVALSTTDANVARYQAIIHYACNHEVDLQLKRCTAGVERHTSASRRDPPTDNLFRFGVFCSRYNAFLLPGQPCPCPLNPGQPVLCGGAHFR